MRWRIRVPLKAPRPRGPEETPALGLHEAHPLVHELEGRLRRAPRLLGSDCEQPLELALVGPQGLEALADRPEQLDDGLADGLLQIAVPRGREALLETLDRLARRDAHDLEQVRDAGLRLRVVADVALRVRDCGLELLPDLIRRVGDVDRALLGRERRRHLLRRLLQVHDPAADLGELAAGDAERLAEAVVEPFGDIARELEML